jgi:RNA polymerase sigma-70 factor (ECF subfamily)
MTDEELTDSIRRMSNGDSEAFQTLYELSIHHVFSTVSFLVNQKQDVCDVVNEVYMELFKSLPSYNFQKTFRSWLNGLIIRQTSNWNRKNWRRTRLNERSKLSETGHIPEPDSKKIFLMNEQCDELFALVQKLSYKHRVVIELRYYQECSFEEISEIIGIPVGTVKSRHHFALEKLRIYKLNKNKEAKLPMEFEDRLKHEFKSKADKLERPLYLDNQIKQIFTNHFKNLTIEIYNDNEYEVARSQAQTINLTEGIRNQLAPGESAFVYIAEK